MSIRKEFVFGFACTALGFRRKVLKCLIAIGRRGRLVLCGLPNVGLMSRLILFIVLLPLGAYFAFCRTYMTCLLLKDFCVWLSSLRCIPALLAIVSALYPCRVGCSLWERVVCCLPDVGLFVCSALVLALADFPMVLAFG